MSPFAIDQTGFSKIVTVVDPSIADSTSTFAVHASSSSSTIFVSGKDIVNHLKSLESDATKVQDLAAPGAADATPAPIAKANKPPVKEKEDAKIEGAVQIAIGVKKEVDFASWYTNVCYPLVVSRMNIPDGDFLQVLIKADMLDYYSVSGCYILKPWSYSIWEEIQSTQTLVKRLCLDCG